MLNWLCSLARSLFGTCEANHESTKAREFKWKIAATTGDNSIPQMQSTNIVAMELLLLALTLDCCSSFSARLEIDSLLFESVCNPLCLSALYCRSLSFSHSRSSSLFRHTDTIESFALSILLYSILAIREPRCTHKQHQHMCTAQRTISTLRLYRAQSKPHATIHSHTHTHTQRHSRSPSCTALAFLLWAIRLVRLFIFIQFENRFGAVRLCCTLLSFYFSMLFPSDLIQL